jgi:hypothetical protein
MTQPLSLQVTTHVFGLGTTRMTEPIFIVVPERETTARALIAEHVHAEVQRANALRTSSLALHYLLADDLRYSAPPGAVPTLDDAAETARAYAGLTERRYMLVVDGVAMHDLDAPLTLTERSRVSFVRLLPLIGG